MFSAPEQSIVVIEEIDNSVYPSKAESLVKRIYNIASSRDLRDYPELIAQGTVGQLMTRGLLERFVKHHPGREEKKQKAMEWLDNILSEMEISG